MLSHYCETEQQTLTEKNMYTNTKIYFISSQLENASSSFYSLWYSFDGVGILNGTLGDFVLMSDELSDRSGTNESSVFVFNRHVFRMRLL